IQPSVASLDVYNCRGTELISVRDLPKDDSITIILPQTSIKQQSVKSTTMKDYYLDKTAMSVHHLNTSFPQRHSFYNKGRTNGRRHEGRRNPIGQNSEQQMSPAISDRYLHVHIRFQPVAKGRRSFPVLVIIRGCLYSASSPGRLDPLGLALMINSVYQVERALIMLPWFQHNHE
ncbi:hypothetical protein PoB_000668900, partial [Plakobranchus ocellatus]